MQNIQIQKAFTLIELLVIVSIIALLIIASTRIDLSRLTQKQQTGLELIKITNIFEEIRNNALIGRWVEEDFRNPDFWKIDISAENNGKIQSFYTLWGVDTIYSNNSWSASRGQKILNLECQSFDGSVTSSLTTWTATLIFEWNSITLNHPNCDSQTQKNLFLRYGDLNISETLMFNTLSWVIKRN